MARRARAEGLGVGWVSILDPGAVHDTLDLPPDWTLIAYLCIGWPERGNMTTRNWKRHGWQKRMCDEGGEAAAAIGDHENAIE